MSAAATATVADDLFFARAALPAYREDPYPLLAELRAEAPVYRSPLGVWLLTRHEDVSRALRDPRVGNRPAERAERAAAVGGHYRLAAVEIPSPISALDRPEHGRIRGVLGHAFPPKAVEPLRARLEQLADELLDAVEARGEETMDVVADLALPFPLTLACELVGVPPADYDAIREWGNVLAANGDPDFLTTPEQRARATAIEREMGTWFAQLVRRRLRQPGGDLLSGFVAGLGDGTRLSFAELVVNGLFFLVNGYHNTVNLIANGVLALLRHPEELARLRRDPSLVRGAVDELLRYDSPIHSIARFTREPYEVGGVAIPEREQLMLLVGAAHRDPAAFGDPDRLDLSRDEARPLSFGGGPHFCMGASLARMEGEIAIGALLRRFPRLELAAEPVRATTFTLRGLSSLRVAIG